MALDLRATCSCSLGPMTNRGGQISDDYLQGSGLVKCQGTVELDGIFTPALGTAVTFTYVKDGITRTVPRKLRVMSSFADPYRRTTKVEVGCKLTYLSDLKESIDWSAFDDPANATLTEADARIITIPIHAASVAQKCLTELGISAAHELPLTNRFSIAKFDYSPGYVQVLGDLLVSESYVGYLDEDELLQVISLDQAGGSGPLITAADLADLGPIGVGQLPGEAVTVSYSTLKLKQPEPDEDGNTLWEFNSTVGQRETFPVPYTSGDAQLVAFYNGRTYSETSTSYVEIKGQDVVNTRRVLNIGPSAGQLGNIAGQYLSAGASFNNTDIILSEETTTYRYNSKGEPEYEETTKRTAAALVYGGFPLVFGRKTDNGPEVISLSYDPIVTERTQTRYETRGDRTQQITSTYKLWGQTQEGQQAIAQAREVFEGAENPTTATSQFLPNLGGLVFDGTVVTSTARVSTQSRPKLADLTNARYARTPASINDPNSDADKPDPNNGYRTESKASLELAIGSADAQRRIEFSLPYAPDDVFTKTVQLGGAVFAAEASDAQAKARRYGICQNRLLLGNRSGMNLQLAPEMLPAAPFAPIIVEANGLSALYRVNASGWTLNTEGAIATTDALFWGAVGSTGAYTDVWFPVSPTITTLPEAPAPTTDPGSGLQIVTTPTVVPVWNETVRLEAGPQIGVTVTRYPYSLQPKVTTIGPIGVQLGAEVHRLVVVKPPTAAMTMTATPPEVIAGVSIQPPTAAMTMTAEPPAINPGSVAPPTAEFSMTATPPVVASADPNFASVSLLLPFNGTNGSTTFTDASSSPKTVTPYGNAQISTVQSTWGGASGLLDGTGDYMVVPHASALNLSSGDFTIECWLYHVARSGATQSVLNKDGVNSAAYPSWGLSVTSAGTLFADLGNGAGLSPTVTSYTFGTLPLTAWTHVAVVKTGTTIKTFLAGTQVTSTAQVTAITDGGKPLLIGAYDGAVSGQFFNGYIDDLRITKGVARYTGNFTPPAAPFPTS